MPVVRLRGHHLLCLLGYRGMGYSEEFSQNMTRVHQMLRFAPETEILIVAGPDDLCAKFPASEPYHCEDANIDTRDAAILRKLGVEAGDTVTWREVEERIGSGLVADDIPVLCSTCPWRSHGVCEEGIDDVKAGKGLREVK